LRGWTEFEKIQKVSDLKNNIKNSIQSKYPQLSRSSNFPYKTASSLNKSKIESINYLENGSIIDTFNSTNDLRNLTINYQSYVIYYNNIEYPVLDFTAATTNINDYIYIRLFLIQIKFRLHSIFQRCQKNHHK
jgi:hypothetical protein